MKRFMIAAALFFTGTFATQAAHAAPKWPKHPNLVAAWANLDKAWGKVSKAQEANADQLGGHGAKAKDFIAAAQADLKQARDSANANKGTGNPDAGAAADCPPAFKFPKHANMAAASKFLVTACTKITAAQKANEFDMDGHAAQAKADIISALGELLAARDFANTK